MEIRETSFFTKKIGKLLDRESYRLLQLSLAAHPESGALIRESGGLRKIRWSGSGRGKRGGTGVIYYWATEDGVILMLMAYAKNEAADLTNDQVEILRRVVEEEFK
jgi:mRNA-degrading endonuclease RelE of RelBE toxin-antitoxin system